MKTPALPSVGEVAAVAMLSEEGSKPIASNDNAKSGDMEFEVEEEGSLKL